MASFPDVAGAFEAARAVWSDLSNAQPDFDWSISGSLHRGRALVTSDRNGTRYFGATVNETVRLARRVPAGKLLLTYDAWSDPGALAALGDQLQPFTDDTSTADDSLRQVHLNSQRANLLLAASREG